MHERCKLDDLDSVGVLRRIRLDLADVDAMHRAVNLDGLDPLAAAPAWMRGRSAVDARFG